MATYIHSSADSHDISSFTPSTAPKVITRAYVRFAPEVDEKAIPELLLSLSLFRQLDIKYAPVPSSSNVFSSSLGFSNITCPVQ
jgi:hypothetical protein